ncbi:MAG: DMT family transporter [Marinicellaceae bacterium]
MINIRIQTYCFTFLALMAFAANSIICRLALKSESIDASSFTAIRLISGVVMFLILMMFNSKPKNQSDKSQLKNIFPAGMLFLYAITFSLAYVSLETGTGALVLFGSVQITMIATSLFSGYRLSVIELFGLLLSFIGLIYLVYPTLSTPSFSGFILMMVAGMAWGIYTLSGRNSRNPLIDTAINFKLTIPLVLILVIVSWPYQSMSTIGIMYAISSGALASALGYTIWFKALKGLSTTEAAVVQLSVPIIAALGGLVFVSEPFNQRVIVASSLVLGGILIVIQAKKYK